MGMVINDEYIDLKEINNIIKCEYIEPNGDSRKAAAISEWFWLCKR